MIINNSFLKPLVMYRVRTDTQCIYVATKMICEIDVYFLKLINSKSNFESISSCWSVRLSAYVYYFSRNSPLSLTYVHWKMSTSNAFWKVHSEVMKGIARSTLPDYDTINWFSSYFKEFSFIFFFCCS